MSVGWCGARPSGHELGGSSRHSARIRQPRRRRNPRAGANWRPWGSTLTLPCSSVSREIGEPLAGTAPVATCWLIIEQAGPWGRQSLLDSHMDKDLGRALTDLAESSGVRILLARHPDRSERTMLPTPKEDSHLRNVWISHTSPGATRMRHGLMSDLTVLTTWDFAAISRGALPAFGESTTEPLTLICTQSGRDSCCAIHGRALLAEVISRVEPAERPTWWECSHIGGHRFAPTALSLPGGTVFGRLTPANMLRIHSDAKQGLLPTASYRGRSAFPPPFQVAEIAVREAAAVRERDSLDVLRVVDGRPVPVNLTADFGSSVMAEVRHQDGRSWHVNVRRVVLGNSRPESCGADAVDVQVWRAEGMSTVSPWRVS